jgi:hypothetical protein
MNTLHSANYAIVITIVAMSSLAIGQTFTPSIDATLKTTADVTGDGLADTVVFHILGDSLSAPFSWTLSIYSSGQTIFQYAQNDSAINEFVGEPAYVGNCSNYFECKQRWYFHDFLPLFLVAERDNFLSTLTKTRVAQLAAPYLVDSCGVHSDQVDSLLDDIMLELKSRRFTLLNHPVGPGYGPLWIFVTRIRRFVPIWDD